MMTILDDLDFTGIRDSIITETTDYLGTYSFPNGGTSEAIAIDLANNKPIKGTWVNVRTNDDIDPTKLGLEILIRPQLGADITNFSGRGKYWNVTSELIFKQWNISPEREQDLVNAVTKVINFVDLGFDTTVRARVPKNPGLGNIETQTVVFRKPIAYKPLVT